MRQTGLKNRFNSEEVQSFWFDWFTDLIDGRNDADCLHHIKSPSSSDYKKPKDGEPNWNESVLNSCPLNNWRNHICQPLHRIELERRLIEKVLKIALERNYKLKDIDLKFLSVYKIIKTKI